MLEASPNLGSSRPRAASDPQWLRSMTDETTTTIMKNLLYLSDIGYFSTPGDGKPDESRWKDKVFGRNRIR
jgi:hypothetical protein